MADPYVDKWAKYGIKAPARRQPSRQDKQNESGADLWRFLGDIAPTAGGVFGGGAGALIGGLAGGNVIPGMAIGSALGGGVGQLAGGAAHAQAEHMVGDQE